MSELALVVIYRFDGTHQGKGDEMNAARWFWNTVASQVMVPSPVTPKRDDSEQGWGDLGLSDAGEQFDPEHILLFRLGR